MRDFQQPGRSAVRATEAMVATSHPLASAAAVDVLKRGGKAVDAAICASAVLAVVEPQSTGVGGDCFALLCPGGQGEVLAFNGSGCAPAAAEHGWYVDNGLTGIPTYGPHSVTIPGAVDAWCRLLADYGSLGLAEVLAPAIRYAEEGYVVHDRVAFDWMAAAGRLAEDAAAARIFLPGGGPPKAGDVHRQPELAETLRLVAREGRAGFYEGRVAEDIVDLLRGLGGHHRLDDLAAARGDYETAIGTTYGDHEVWQMPPANQGVTALLMLNILAGFGWEDRAPLGADRLHLEIEAARLAYRARDLHVGDPSSARVTVGELLSEATAGRLRAEIRLDRATLPPVPELRASDTICLSVVDRDRNAVSFINSTYHSFGSGLVTPKTGIILQNRGASFRLDPAHPNRIGPNKRPMHTIMPGMLSRAGRVTMPYGVMGGDYQPTGHVHVLSNILDFGMNVQEAIDAPRVFFRGDAVLAERGVPHETLAGLQDRGHRIELSGEPLGGGQGVFIDWEKGTLTGGSDHRKDGCALGF